MKKTNYERRVYKRRVTSVWITQRVLKGAEVQVGVSGRTWLASKFKDV